MQKRNRWQEQKDQEKWALKFNECILCKTNEVPHQAKGLCYNCYHRVNGLNGKWGKENPKLYMRCRDAWDLANKKYRLKKAKERYYRLKKEVPNFNKLEGKRVKKYILRKSSQYLKEDVANLLIRIGNVKKRIGA